VAQIRQYVLKPYKHCSDGSKHCPPLKREYYRKNYVPTLLPDGRKDFTTLGTPELLIRNGACCKHNKGFHTFQWYLYELDCGLTGMKVTLGQCDDCKLCEPKQVKLMADINHYPSGI